jgi:HD-GYP domain-containing protein (c-di-GMP phosphodiesterase class II)
MFPLQTNSLRENAVLSSDVYDKAGNLLLTRGTRLRRSTIENLIGRGIDEIFLHSREEALILTQKTPPLEATVSFREFSSIAEMIRIYDEPGVFPNELLDEVHASLSRIYEALQNRDGVDYERLEHANGVLLQFIEYHRGVRPRLSDLRLFDRSICTHSVNVALISLAVASTADFDHDRLRELGIGALLHDAGYTEFGVDNVRGFCISDGEGASPIPIATHPEIGVRLLTNSGYDDEAVLRIVYNHHERHDGLGYPRKLSGSSIGLPASLVAVANDFEKVAIGDSPDGFISMFNVMARIIRDSGRAYSPIAARTFSEVMGIYPIGSFVVLSSGEVGLVVENSSGNILTPRLMVLRNAEGDELTEPDYIDLVEADGAFIERVLDPVEEFSFSEA